MRRDLALLVPGFLLLGLVVILVLNATFEDEPRRDDAPATSRSEDDAGSPAARSPDRPFPRMPLPDPGVVPWLESLEKGLEQARETERLVLVYVAEPAPT